MEVALEAGADDILTTKEGYEVRCAIPLFDKVAHALEHAGIKPASAEISHIPLNLVPVTSLDAARSLFRLQDALDDDEDVQSFFSNEELDDALAEAARAG